ncbi:MULTISPECIES: TniB family NTP-binding protein [unclassified Ensifer]|uniref:TniB family NTP-binding protein n=1 Tax=unclassified Ensifer TaxID=2633371 RepID=UPI0009F72B5D|nr:MULTISPECIES: TniB family NTP-binding protein [unclassified Ensifer]
MRVFPEFHRTTFLTDDQRRAASELPPAERQSMVTNLVVPSKQFNRLSGKVARFHRHVDGGVAGPGWVGGLLGESRAGKTTILQSYAQKFPAVLGENGYTVPVLYIEARDDWDLLEFGRQIYFETAASSIPRLSTASVNTQAARRIGLFGVELIIIDDAHRLFGQVRKTTSYVSLLTAIANTRKCNILLAGLPSIRDAIEAIPHLKNRGGFPHDTAYDFDADLPDDREQFRVFLEGVDRRLPFLRKSNLSQKAYVADFLHVSGGSIGNVMNIVIDAAFMAINEKRNCIMASHLRAAALERMHDGTKAASNAKRYIPFNHVGVDDAEVPKVA